MNNNTQETTFWRFLQKHKVEIPIIQRDYAQGRIGKEKLRETFLKDLINALDGKMLKLDFVYGSIENGNLNPLDGQQRLTTLWLLHWYVAYKAGKLAENKEMFKRFTYETRVTSREFCEKLSDFTEPTGNKIVEHIQNQTWFFSAWKQDPTIQAMLNMLSGTSIEDKDGDIIDGIEELFNDECDFTAYWGKLTADNCPIIFYYLPLNELKLSDDLYVKMNARGKSLTSFENFKADLVGYIKKKTENKEWATFDISGFEHKLDTDWTDIFWKNKSSEHKIDDIYFAFLNRYFLNALITAKDNTKNDLYTQEKIESNKLFNYLHADKSDAKIKYDGFDLYSKESDVFVQNLFERLSRTLDKFSDVFKAKNKDELKNLFLPNWAGEDSKFSFIPEYSGKDDISALTHKQRVVFHAICCYFEKGVYDETSLKQWMRVVWNIVENANITTIPSMIGAMRLIDELAKHSHGIYMFLANDAKTISSTIARDQVTEEKEKAKLRSDAAWEKELIIAEDNSYFKGQIYFLLHISNQDLNTFIQYRNKATAVFHERMQESPCLFHRALLVLSENEDYSKKESAGRWSFLKNDSDIKHAFLRHGNDDFYYTLIKLLLDKVQSVSSVSSEMEKIIKEVTFDETQWQTFFITTPYCFNYCEQKLVKWCSEKEVYLLKKSQMNHHHAELRTYYLWKEWIENKKRDFEPFKNVGYWETANSQDHPCAYLDNLSFNNEHYALNILYKDSKYQLRLFIREPKGNMMELLYDMNAKAELGFLEEKNSNWYSKQCDMMSEVKELILGVCESLKKLLPS